jgi:hypothetical protein
LRRAEEPAEPADPEADLEAVLEVGPGGTA